MILEIIGKIDKTLESVKDKIRNKNLKEAIDDLKSIANDCIDIITKLKEPIIEGKKFFEREGFQTAKRVAEELLDEIRYLEGKRGLFKSKINEALEKGEKLDILASKLITFLLGAYNFLLKIMEYGG